MKQKIRSEVLLKRLHHKPLLKKRKDHNILQQLKKLPEFKKATSILFYLPVQGEVDLSALISISLHSLKLNKKFVLPKANRKTHTLALYHIQSLRETQIGAFKIPEPDTKLPKIKPADIDLVLIPGIAFSPDGHRIGYGRGFYDRLLKKLTCPKIGIAYSFQIVKNVPGEKHDVPVDMILTEKGLINSKHPHLSRPAKNRQKALSKKNTPSSIS